MDNRARGTSQEQKAVWLSKGLVRQFRGGSAEHPSRTSSPFCPSFWSYLLDFRPSTSRIPAKTRAQSPKTAHKSAQHLLKCGHACPGAVNGRNSDLGRYPELGYRRITAFPNLRWGQTGLADGMYASKPSRQQHRHLVALLLSPQHILLPNFPIFRIPRYIDTDTSPAA